MGMQFNGLTAEVNIKQTGYPGDTDSQEAVSYYATASGVCLTVPVGKAFYMYGVVCQDTDNGNLTVADSSNTIVRIGYSASGGTVSYTPATPIHKFPAGETVCLSLSPNMVATVTGVLVDV